MLLGLLGAFGAALAYGVASVLQALAARRQATVEGLDPRLFLRLLRSWPYLLGLGLDGLGFLMSTAALRTLPLFVVQAIVSSFLAVTAVLGAVVLKMPLTRNDKIGLTVVVAGLVLVGASAAEDKPVPVSLSVHWGILAVAALLGVLAVPLARLTGAAGAAALGGLAGLEYGVVAVAARVLPDPLTFSDLIGTPSTYALVLAGAVAMLLYPTALQRGTVTQATAPLVVAQTLGPAIVGLLLLGDQARPGWGVVGAVGFLLAVTGAVSLSRHGEVEEPARTAAGA